MLKKALITGSAQGIGRAIALDLARRGFDLAIHYHQSQTAAHQVHQMVQSEGVNSVVLQADITQPNQAELLVETAAEQLGGLSVLVNTVGNYSQAQNKTSQVLVEEWQGVMDSNLNSTFYVTRSAIPHLQKAGGGRILNFACVSAQHLTARQTNTPYFIAKMGIILYAKSLAKELISEKITVNVISPGIAENSFDVAERQNRLPLKRPATLAEIVEAVWFFLRPEAAYITGQNLEIAGGWLL